MAIALKIEPVEVHDMCLAGCRQDLLARFGRLEQSYGFKPGPYTAPYVVETVETARRRERFLAGEGERLATPAPPAPSHETVTAPEQTNPRRHAPGGPGQKHPGRGITW